MFAVAALAIVPLILLGLKQVDNGGGVAIAGAVFCAMFVGYCISKEA